MIIVSHFETCSWQVLLRRKNKEGWVFFSFQFVCPLIHVADDSEMTQQITISLSRCII